jgi:xanthine dehydrogenase accessory factor
MDSLDIRVLSDALAWRTAGHAVTLVTVVQTWGSAPRPPGALLAVRDDGLVSGSVSGGCVEDDLIARTKAAFAQLLAQQTITAPASSASASAPSLPSEIVYGVSKEEAARFGLPCGGTLRLVHEPLLAVDWIATLLARTADHQLVSRTLTMATGAVELAAAQRGQDIAYDGQTLTTVFGPKWRLLLIGAGQLSQAVAQMAGMLDFEVLVCDPREEYAATLDLSLVQRLVGMPDDVVREIVPDPHTAIVALTHDPKLDDMALLEALKSEAFYVGALGSARTQAARKQRLAEHFEMTQEELQRLRGPVGLRLGAKTPAEIAVSIVAEIVQVKNAGMAAGFADSSCAVPAAPAV